MSPGAPDFSPLAATYARVRPRYPGGLYAWLGSLVERHDLAWDCATGSGQAAVGLADHFARVVASDRSTNQLSHALPHRRIEYRVAAADRSGLSDASVDLVTVAAALHWLDQRAFFAEVRRVVRPGGVLAAWSYHPAIVDPPFHEVFRRAWEVLEPYAAAGTALVDARYESIDTPGESVAPPAFAVEVAWTLEQALDFVRSWSASMAYREALGADAAETIRADLAAIYEDPDVPLRVRMPLFLRVSRL